MPMSCGQVVTYVRTLTTKPFPQNLSDAEIIAFINSAQSDLAMEVRQPGAVWTFTTVAPANSNIVPEYSLRAYVDIKKVTLAGQIIVPTSIPSLEGAQIQLYDSSATNSGPQWSNQSSESYPYPSPTGTGGGFPQPINGMPFIIGGMPRYYIRDLAQIGFVPPPNGQYQAQLDVITMPLQLTSTSSISPFDPLYLDALGWRTAQKCHSANGADPQRLVRAQECQQGWLDALARLRTFVRTSNTGNPSGITVLTMRTSNNAPRRIPLGPGGP